MGIKNKNYKRQMRSLYIEEQKLKNERKRLENEFGKAFIKKEKEV